MCVFFSFLIFIFFFHFSDADRFRRERSIVGHPQSMAAQLAKESPMKPLFEKGGDANPIQPSTFTNGNSSFESKMILYF